MGSNTGIRVGIIGLSTTGWASLVTAPSILNTPSYHITAVSTRSASSAQAAAEHQFKAQGGQVEVNAYYGETASGIWSDPNVDLVIVSVPAAQHLSVIKPLLSSTNPKDFLVEWPVGMNVKETEEIEKIADTVGVKAAVVLQGLYSPVYAKVKELIESGIIGKILSTTLLHVTPVEWKAWGPIISPVNERTMIVRGGTSLLCAPIGHSLAVLQKVMSASLLNVSAHGRTMHKTYQLVDTGGKALGEPKKTEVYDHIYFSGALDNGVFISSTWKGGYKTADGQRKTLVWLIDGEEGSIRRESDTSNGPFLCIEGPVLYVNGEKMAVDGADGVLGNYIGLWKTYAQGETEVTLKDVVALKHELQVILRSAQEGRMLDVKM
ncbi:NAD-binding Rossmann fold oxidoreductase [Flagelloscypha sp. PMI_526]|nr:NAD-binding Rossmann fold oxidoreductase [Flagelloscypha sp. PMI_526]